MIAHTPTLFGCVALVATIMAFCLILVGQFNRRDGLLTIGFGLLAHALAYVGYTFYGHAPLWFTYGAANPCWPWHWRFMAPACFGLSSCRCRGRGCSHRRR